VTLDTPVEVQVRRAPVIAVRVTRLEADGAPDHRQPLVYRFAAPVWFCHATRRALPDVIVTAPFREVTARRQAMSVFVAEHNHLERHQIESLADALWQLRHDGAAVEVWGSGPLPGQWWYALVPRWRHTDPGDWPAREPSAHHLYAAGQVTAPSAWAWPEPPPVDAPPPVGAYAELVYAVTGTPPPSTGLEGTP